MAPGGDFLARLWFGDDIVDEVDYRNKAARKAWRQAGREFRGEVAQHPQVPELMLPPNPHHAPQAAGGSRSTRSTQEPREKSARYEVIREPCDKIPSRRQTVREGGAKEARPPPQGNQPPMPMRRETVSHRSDRKQAHLEVPPRKEGLMDIYAIGKYGGVSPRASRNDPQPAPQLAPSPRDHRSGSKATRQSSHRGGPACFPEQQLAPPPRDHRSGSKSIRQSSHRGAPAGLPEQLRHPEAMGGPKRSTRASGPVSTSTRGHQYENYHGNPVLEIQPRASRHD